MDLKGEGESHLGGDKAWLLKHCECCVELFLERELRLGGGRKGNVDKVRKEQRRERYK